MTWKDKLVQLSKDRRLYGPERWAIERYLTNPMSTEKSFRICFEELQPRVESRPHPEPLCSVKHETWQCKKCGADFDQDVGYVGKARFAYLEYCPTCQAEKEAEWRAKEQARIQAENAAKRAEWRRTCGIPALFAAKDFSTFDRKWPKIGPVYEKAVKYAEGFPIAYDDWLRSSGQAYPSLLLYSNEIWGNGKTYLASAIAHRILDRWDGEQVPCPALFVSEPEIYASIQETYSYTSEQRERGEKPTEQKIINRLVAARLLILDDLGKQERRDMDFVRRTLFDIINRRYNAMRPMIITSNKDSGALKTYLGKDEAILDRLFEMTDKWRIHVASPSYRRRA